ncbi:type II secretion system protein GspH [Endozoicomonas sp. OPT23]|uniref:type II secretion system minor pseudopilin GspH n=1 Tax=Endozoicomonas sp. OPT23 TaxID=2072845 RepID=UPI00129ABA2A|nr:type II secretion system protein GspH [Endozoicomonas sp. OPT23]
MRRLNKGFTLLEIMLVLVLLSLAASVIIPRLPSGSSGSDLYQQSEKFAALARAANQQALLEGKTLGLKLTSDNDYEFMLLADKGWEKLGKNRLFRPVSLPKDIQLTYSAGDSFWREALEYEQDDSNSIYFPDDEQAAKQPDIIFWSSGEISPSNVSFCLGKSETNCQWVVLEETGEVLVKENLNG